jgi:hypothetical protein
VVDEGQGFREVWWVAVEDLLRDPTGSTLWVFLDPLRDIFDGGPTEALGLVPAQLTINCRNTRRIADYCSRLVGAEARIVEGAPEGVEVTEVSTGSEAETVDEVRKAVRRLVHEGGLPADRLIVFSARAAHRSPVWKQGKLGNYQLVEYPTPPGPNQVAFATLQRFKGLEADAVILCAAARAWRRASRWSRRASWARTLTRSNLR